jgi:hypothetical protein
MIVMSTASCSACVRGGTACGDVLGDVLGDVFGASFAIHQTSVAQAGAAR